MSWQPDLEEDEINMKHKTLNAKHERKCFEFLILKIFFCEKLAETKLRRFMTFKKALDIVRWLWKETSD